MLPNEPHFDGKTYDVDRDHERLTGQLQKVYKFMMDQEWHTLEEIAEATQEPMPSVSTRLRDLRKKKFGGHTIERRHKGRGLFEYRLAAGPGIGMGLKMHLPLEDERTDPHQDIGILTHDQAKAVRERGASKELKEFYAVQEKYGHGHHVTRLDRLKKCRDPKDCYQCQKVIEHINYLKKKGEQVNAI